ncbi:tyrosine-protein phosphatase [Streptomyces sp. NPDC055749]
MHPARARLAIGFVIATLTLTALPASAVAEAEARAPIVADTGQHTAARQITLQGAVNVRDLGGYRTYTGRSVRYGHVFRADALSKLTDPDVATLSGLGLKKVVDFRVPLELQYDGADRLPAGPAVTSRAVDDRGLYGMTMSVIASKDPVVQRAALGDGKAERFMRDIYRTFVDNPASRAQFAATVRELAKGRHSAPLLYHCTSGKDRTGWMSYVLLRALGVPEQAAERDFLLSNTFRAAHDAKVRAGLKQSGMMQNPDLLIPLQEVRTSYLGAALDQVEKDYGSLYGYLTDGLGLDIPTLARLRHRLLR